MCASSLLVAVFVTLLAVVLAHGARRWLAFRALARALGGSGVGPRFSATVGGERYVCHYSYGRTRGGPSRLTVEVDAPSMPAFRVMRPSVATTAMLAVGLGRAVRTGVPAMDDAYVVACDAGEWAAAVFREPPAAEALIGILGSGFTDVRADGAHLVAEWTGFAMREDFSPSLVLGVVRHLTGLRDAVASVVFSTPVAAPSRGRRRALAAIPAAVFAAGAGLLMWGSAFHVLDARAMLWHSLRVSVPWLAFFLVAGAPVFRLSTTSPRDVIRLASLAALGFTMTGYAADVALNCALDAAPPAVHHAVVVDRTITSGRGGTQYWAVVRSWRGAPTETIPVPWRVYERLVPESTELAVTTRPGRLGFEWLVDHAVDG
jgi:hypothetical protein